MTFNHKTILNFYIAFEIHLQLLNFDSKFTLVKSLFKAAKLTRNADLDIYLYSGYFIGFDICGLFSMSDGNNFGKNVTLFGVDNSSSAHTDKFLAKVQQMEWMILN